jgi:hypothetical protein
LEAKKENGKMTRYDIPGYTGDSLPLDTGDNPTHRQHMLDRVCRDLEGPRCCRVLFPILDDVHRRCALKCRQDATDFIVVARDARDYAGIVSTQNQVLALCIKNGWPLVMYVDDEYYVFDAKHCMILQAGVNTRFTENMTNFNLERGVVWSVDKTLAEAYALAQLQDNHAVRANLLNFTEVRL